MGIQPEVQVIERALKKRGVTQTKLAEELGIRVPAITEMFKGDRRLQLVEKVKAYRLLQLDSVPVVGFVGASQTAGFFDKEPEELDRVPAPENVTENTVAVEIRGDSMGAPLNGWLVYYDDVHRGVTRELLNQLCVVGLSDGRVLIKKVQPSKVKGLFHLIPVVGEAIMDVPIEWAAKVLRMQPRR